MDGIEQRQAGAGLSAAAPLGVFAPSAFHLAIFNAVAVLFGPADSLLSPALGGAFSI